MTTERQRAANRQNAQKSTGPRTAEGRKRSASNSRRHGMTGSIAEENVAEWFKLILSDSDAEPNILDNDRLRRSALRLAMAEARLNFSRQSFELFLINTDEYCDFKNIFFDGDDEHVDIDRLRQKIMKENLGKYALRILATFELAGKRRNAQKRQLRTDTKKLLQRYLRASELGRQKALRDLVEAEYENFETNPFSTNS